MDTVDIIAIACFSLLAAWWVVVLVAGGRSSHHHVYIGTSRPVDMAAAIPQPPPPKPKRKRAVKNRYPDFSLGNGDDVDLLVCADYLEDRGEAQQAAWMRMAVEELRALAELRERLATVKYGRMVGVVPRAISFTEFLRSPLL